MASFRNLSNQGYDVDLFANTPEAYHLCTACRNVLREPRQTECGHRICRGCLDEILGDNPQQPVCPDPDCAEPLTKTVFADRSCETELQSLPCRCRQREHGCTWTGPLQDLERHLNNDCLYHPCQYCSHVVLQAAEMENHFQECGKFPTTCRECDQRNIPRNELPQHTCVRQSSVQCSDHAVGESVRTVIYHGGDQSLIGVAFRSLEMRNFQAQGRILNLEEQLRVLEGDRGIGLNRESNLIWKIDGYDSRNKNAQTGKTPFIDSPPLNIGKYGYKVCARMYPNGDGIGEGTHLSLHFVIMKGEFDALLPWPFRQKVTLKLFDQDGQDYVAESFRPDPTSTSFKRPTSDMNIASVCPLFISHSILQNHAYIKDDTMFIKLSVDRSGLTLPEEQ